MDYSVKDVVRYVADSDVKFVKLTFCDIFGRHKNVSIVASELERILSEGFLTGGDALGFHAEGRLRLVPDPGTLYVLPWRPQSGRVVSILCNVESEHGKPCEADPMRILAGAVARLERAGCKCSIGTGCEFYVLRADDGVPRFEPYDRAGYYDAAPLDKCENIRRDIVLSLATMGIKPVSSHHERGHGQNSIEFKSSDPMTAAKNMLIYKSAVRNVCVACGVYATFMPLPFPGLSDSGMHISIELSGSPSCAKFARGIEDRIGETAGFLSPTHNGFNRLAARGYTGGSGIGELRRNVYELHVADNTCNPYLAFALLLHAGMDGVEGVAAKKSAFPSSAGEAAARIEKGEFVRSVLPGEIVGGYAQRLRDAEKKYEGMKDTTETEREEYLDC